MTKPTLQEIEEAIRTLTNAGMLLNAEQTIAVNRVRQEIKQQAEVEKYAAETQRRQQKEERRRAEGMRQQTEVRRLSEPISKADNPIKQTEQDTSQNDLSHYDNVQFSRIWDALNDRQLRTAFKKRIYAEGMRGSMCTSRMAHLSYKLKEVENNPHYRTLVENCRTFAEMRKIFDSLLISWGDEKRFEWRKQFFHDFLNFVQSYFIKSNNR